MGQITVAFGPDEIRTMRKMMNLLSSIVPEMERIEQERRMNATSAVSNYSTGYGNFVAKLLQPALEEPVLVKLL